MRVVQGQGRGPDHPAMAAGTHEHILTAGCAGRGACGTGCRPHHRTMTVPPMAEV